MHYSSIATTADRLRSGELLPTDLVEALLTRIERLDPLLDAYAHLDPGGARAAAARAEQEIREGNWRGPLHGIPIAVKDLYAVAGMPTTFGSPHLADHHLTQEAEVVGRLRDAGAIVLGTLRMSEAALTDHGPGLPTPINPWGEDIWVGTSSSGSAAATAAGMCFAALGSDTGGSVRGPSTATGLTGLKRTRGLIPTGGTLPLSRTLDTLGPFTRSARDCRILLEAMAQQPVSSAGPDGVEGHGLAGVHIGMDRRLLETVSAPIREAIERTAERFTQLGATLQEVSAGEGSRLASEWVGFVGREALEDLEELYPRGSEHLFGPEVAHVLEQGRAATAEDLARAEAETERFTAETDRALTRVDALLLPTIAAPSPTVHEIATMRESYRVWNDQVMRLCCPYNFSGHPSLTFPTGFTPHGTPLGAQLVGAHHAESALLSIVEAFQEGTDFHLRRPEAIS